MSESWPVPAAPVATPDIAANAGEPDTVAPGRVADVVERELEGEGPPFRLPWLPPGATVQVAGRGEFFVRHHRHPDPAAPTLMLFHGWTASGDLQFFTAYRELAEHWSFVAIDHRGHGRGLRTLAPFTLEDAADDAAAVLRELGLGPVTTVGYSMGGPISMLMARRHPDLVSGMVVQATGLEWSATISERLTWMWLPVLGAILRSWAYPRYLRRAIARIIPVGHELEPYLPWIVGEVQRGTSHTIVQAGSALRRYDARGWASGLGVPADLLLTTRDRLVRPRKQRQLALALRAVVHELDGDHLCTMEQPAEYAAITVEQVRAVIERSAVGRGG
jgi:pimeloyl-ACP methyl ester carboxylesterase